MQLMNNLRRTKNFVQNHKGAIVVALITVPVVVNQARAIQKMNGFLAENNLFNEYYGIPEL